jgi:hypothetical protein
MGNSTSQYGKNSIFKRCIFPIMERKLLVMIPLMRNKKIVKNEYRVGNKYTYGE